MLSCLKVILDVLQRFGFTRPNDSNELIQIINSEGALLGALKTAYPTIRSWFDVLSDSNDELKNAFDVLLCPVSQGLCLAPVNWHGKPYEALWVRDYCNKSQGEEIKAPHNPNFEIDKSVLLAEPINSMGQELIKTKCDSSDNHALYYLSQISLPTSFEGLDYVLNHPGADQENLLATYLKAWLVQGMPVYTKYPMHFFASLLRKLVEFQKSLESDL